MEKLICNKVVVCKKVSLVFTFYLLSQLSFAGGAWTQGKGKAYFKLSEFWILFDEHFTASGEIDPNTTTGIFNTYLYGEYGLTDKLTLTTNAALFTNNFMRARRSSTGTLLTERDGIKALGDIDFGVKYQLSSSDSPIAIAASLNLGLPTGRINAGRDNNLQTGDGEFNQQIQLDIGKGFQGKSNAHYVNAYVAFNNRTSTGDSFAQRIGRGLDLGREDIFSDEFRFGMEYGIGMMERKLWVIARFYLLESLRNGDDFEQSTNIFANNTEYTGTSLEVSYYILEKLGIAANVGGAFRGEIIAASPSFDLGVFLDLSK